MDTTTQITDKPLVSILMLTYNRAHFLPEAIKSVLMQTYQNWELVVIDDGSADTTKELMGSFHDSRILYIRHEKNAGLFVRRAESLNYTVGRYTAILDSDDYWTQNTKLEEQVSFLETHSDHVVVGTNAHIVTETGNVTGETHYAILDEVIRRKILSRNQFIHSSILMRTETLRRTTGYQPTLAEDLELILQLGTLGKIANLEGVYSAHRVHHKSENDRGLKMALAVDTIIRIHQKAYPRYLLAKTVSYLRMLRTQLKGFLS